MTILYKQKIKNSLKLSILVSNNETFLLQKESTVRLYVLNLRIVQEMVLHLNVFALEVTMVTDMGALVRELW